MGEIYKPLNPTNDPEYLRSSRAITPDSAIKPQGVEQNTIMPHGVLRGDQSAEFEGNVAKYNAMASAESSKGFGDLFAGIVAIGDFALKAGDALIKKDIENKVYDLADAERVKHTATLEGMLQGRGSKTLLDANASADMPDVPEELTGIRDSMASLDSARQSGKISNSYYYSRLEAEAKMLRQKYPGYRSYIDQQFAQVTGVNPANAYVGALIQDINRSQGAAAANYNKMMQHTMQRSNFPNSTEVMQKIESGQITTMSQVMHAFSPYEKIEQARKDELFRLQWDKGTHEEKLRKANEHAVNQVSTEIRYQIDRSMITAKMQTPAQLMDLVARQRAGTLPDEEVIAITGQLKLQRDLIYRKMVKDFDVVQDDGKTTFARLGSRQAGIDHINQGLSEMDEFIKMVEKKEFSPAYHAANVLRGRTDDENLKLVTTIKPFMQMRVLRQNNGDQWATTYFESIVKNQVGARYDEYIAKQDVEIVSQSNHRETGAPPVTFKSTYEERKLNNKLDPKTNEKTFRQIDMLNDPKTPEQAKRDISLAAYSQGNLGFISTIPDEKGRYAAYERMTSMEKAQSQWDLGQKQKVYWNNYKNWTENTTANEVFNKEFNDLKGFMANSRIKIEFNPESNRLEVRGLPTKSASTTPGGAYISSSREFEGYADMATKQRVEGITRSVNRINSGLSSLENIAKLESRDVTKYLGGFLSAISGVPAEKFQKKSEATGEPSNTALSFAEAPRPQSMSAWLMNPTGTPGGGQTFTPETAPITPPIIENNAPAGSAGRSRGVPGIDNVVPGSQRVIDVTDIPEGMSPKEWIRKLKADDAARGVKW